MDDTRKIAMVKVITDFDPLTSDDEVCSVYLQLAADQILQRLYPFGTDETEIPSQYDTLQCQLASRLILRKGAEGETIHNENGIYRTYGTVDDEDLLSRVTPYAKLAGE